jgi:hypothetical protein
VSVELDFYPNVCAKLRWKGMYVDALRDRSIPGTSDGFCWCLHTQNCLGPDGHVADRDSCGPGRSCFESR